MSLIQWKSIFEEMAVIAEMKSSQLDANGNCSIINAHPLCPAIHVYYDKTSDTVAIFSEVGFINCNHESNLMRIVLRQNYLKSIGLTYALAPTGALIAQMFLNVSQLIPPELATDLNRFTVELMKTRRMLFMTKQPSVQPSTSELMTDNAIMI